MDTVPNSADIILEPADNERLANLCGQFDEHLRQIERRLGVEINNRGNMFRIIGDSRSVQAASEIIFDLYRESEKNTLNPARINLFLQESGVDALLDEETSQAEVILKLRTGAVKGRGPHQQRYLRNILTHDISFGVGPAGTGKTYLAVACAVEALQRDSARAFGPDSSGGGIWRTTRLFAR